MASTASLDAPEAADTAARGRRPPEALAAFAADLGAFAGRRAFLIAGLLLTGALVEGIGIVLLVPLLTVVLGTGAGEGWLGDVSAWVVALAPAATPAGRIAFLLCLFALLLALRGLVIVRRDVELARLESGFVESHRLRTVELLTRTRWDVLARLRHGRVTHVLGGDMQSAGAAAALLLHALVAATLLGGQLALAFLLSPPLALLMLIVLGGGALALRPVLRRSRALGTDLTQSNLGLVVSTTEFLGGLKLALSQNLQASFLGEFGETLRRATARRIAFARQRSLAQFALTAVAAFVAGLVMLLGIAVLAAPAATVIAFIFILARMNGPAAQVQNAGQMVFHSLPAYGQIRALQEELETAASDAPAVARGHAPLAGPVRFEDVSYRHRGGEAAGGVSGLNLTLAEGEFVGMAGPSGAGKTTFADLLAGLYAPQRGRVTVAGRTLEGAALAAWRESLAYVSQDPFLFHDSVRRNLLWARPGAGEAELWSALELAGASEMVCRLDGGLDAVLGERGTLLSGGERQRIALARAMVRRPRLLLLDEATSAIDVAGESAILKRLAALSDRPTLVMIAHRPESLAFCDRVIALEGGCLGEAMR